MQYTDMFNIKILLKFGTINNCKNRFCDAERTGCNEVQGLKTGTRYYFNIEIALFAIISKAIFQLFTISLCS